LYHGTSVEDALGFLNNQRALDAAMAAARKIDGGPGFHLATDYDAAEFYALRRAPGAVVEYHLSAEAMRQLRAAGLIEQSIPAGPRSPPIATKGKELIVPPEAFDLFNRLRSTGEIRARPPSA
jgi:hypothetical protein